MRKTLTIALVWATLSLFSTGCVDVAAPGGNNPADPNSPTDPSNPTNPTDPTNPSNPSNPTVPTDPSDPLYPGEPGVTYTTTWDNFDQTQTPQRYIGVDYDAEHKGIAPQQVSDSYTAPYKTTFSDGAVAYSVLPFQGATYTRNTSAIDFHSEGTAPDGFVITDYTYDKDNGGINFKDNGKSFDSTGTTEGKYTTVYNGDGRGETRSSKQPILSVTYNKSSKGEIYYGTTDVLTYATTWDNGDYTLSIYPFAGVNYYNNTTAKYSADSQTSNSWEEGTAPNGHKESDYSLVDGANGGKEYKYIGAAANPVDDLIEDAEDVLVDILDNDGAPIAP